MSIEISFPDLPTVPDVVTLQAPVFPEWEVDIVAELARAHEIDAEVVDAGPWFVARGERAALEVYQATHSFRFGLVGGDSESIEPVDVDDGTAVEVALDWVRRFGDLPVRREGITVTSEELLISEAPDTEPVAIVTGRQVNLPLEIDGLPALGPGAKAQVTLGAGLAITSAYRFWRETKTAGERRIEPLEAVAERFREARLFEGLRSGSAEVTGIRLGHYSDPPTEVQRHLRPAYEFTGVLRVEGAEPYEFIQYAPAAAVPADKPRRRLLLRPNG